jgi:hypothetical protein
MQYKESNVVPLRTPARTAMLELILGGIKGPKAVPGLIITTSKPVSLANSQPAFSASVFAMG